MKIGYSLILGEHVDASRLSHRDCEPYQIVCPACKEPVFKVERKTDQTQIDYLAHYTSEKAYNSECELRVSSMSKEVLEKSDKISRNQRLEYFLGVLRELIGRNPMYPNGTTKSQAVLNKSKTVGFLRDTHYEHSCENRYTAEMFNEFVDEYIVDITQMGGIIETSFAISVQKRIAFDIWQHLLTKKGRANYEFLFNHAYLVVMTRCQRAIDLNKAVPEMGRLLDFLSSILQTSKQKGYKILSEMGHTPVGPPFAIEDSNYFNKAASDISHEMIGCLLELQYFDILKNKLIKTGV